MTTDRRTDLGHHVRMHAVAVRACMPSLESDSLAAINAIARTFDEPFMLDPSELPHALVPVPPDEVWFYDGDGERHVLGPKTPPSAEVKGDPDAN